MQDFATIHSLTLKNCQVTLRILIGLSKVRCVFHDPAWVSTIKHVVFNHDKLRLKQARCFIMKVPPWRHARIDNTGTHSNVDLTSRNGCNMIQPAGGDGNTTCGWPQWSHLVSDPSHKEEEGPVTYNQYPSTISCHVVNANDGSLQILHGRCAWLKHGPKVCGYTNSQSSKLSVRHGTSQSLNYHL